VVQAGGALGPLIAELAMRRLWNIGPHVYQPLAVQLPLGPSATMDLVVRRKNTLEPVVVASAGSPLAALLRALDHLAYLRRPAVGAALLPELSRRSTFAGIAQVNEVRQALVVATPEVLDEVGVEDLPALAEIRKQLEPGPLGFRFLEVTGSGDGLQLRAAPGPWDAVSLVRAV
jgi:hypothetical protein